MNGVLQSCKFTCFSATVNTFSDSVTIPGNLDFILEANPVSMPARQTVTGTFQTTDAESATAEGEIKLIYAGTDSLQPKDFTLSSEEDGTAYGGVTLLAVTTENGTGSIKIQFAKSLDLGNKNSKIRSIFFLAK